MLNQAAFWSMERRLPIKRIENKRRKREYKHLVINTNNGNLESKRKSTTTNLRKTREKIERLI